MSINDSFGFAPQNIARSAVFDVMQRNSSDNNDEIGGNVAGGEDGSGVALETGFDHEQGRQSLLTPQIAAS